MGLPGSSQGVPLRLVGGLTGLSSSRGQGRTVLTLLGNPVADARFDELCPGDPECTAQRVVGLAPWVGADWVQHVSSVYRLDRHNML